MTTFRDILNLRGRIVLFTATSDIGLLFERMAETYNMPVIHTRGWADPYGPLGTWARIHAAREYGVFSCDQRRYVAGYKVPATDLVWVGSVGDPVAAPHIHHRHQQAMQNCGDADVRRWLLQESDL